MKNLSFAVLFMALTFLAASSAETATLWPKPKDLTWAKLTALEQSSVPSTPRFSHRKNLNSGSDDVYHLDGWICQGQSGPGGVGVIVYSPPHTPPKHTPVLPPPTPELPPPTPELPPPTPEIPQPTPDVPVSPGDGDGDDEPATPPDNQDGDSPSPSDGGHDSPSPPEGGDDSPSPPDHGDYDAPSQQQPPSLGHLTRCFSNMPSAMSCYADVMGSYYSRMFRVSQDCCKIILDMEDECSDLVSNFFSDRFFCPALQYTCYNNYN